MPGAVIAHQPRLGGASFGRAPWPRVIGDRQPAPDAVASRRRARVRAGDRHARGVRRSAAEHVCAARHAVRRCRFAPVRFAVGSSATSARSGTGRCDFAAIQGMLWPISFSIAATALAVGRGDHGDRGAGAAGAAGAADAVDVVVGMVRHVEIEDVADVGNVEAARGDVGGDQQRDLALAELIERGRARGLVQVAVQRERALKPWRTSERCSVRDLALAVAEDDRVLEVRRPRGSRRRSVSRLSCGSRPVLTRSWVVVATVVAGCDTSTLHRIVQELLGDAPDLRRHGGGEEQRLAGERHELADALDVRE